MIKYKSKTDEIKKWMDMRQINITQCAKLLNMDISNVRKYLNNELTPSMDFVGRIVYHSGMPITSLFERAK